MVNRLMDWQIREGFNLACAYDDSLHIPVDLIEMVVEFSIEDDDEQDSYEHSSEETDSTSSTDEDWNEN